jgi:hypothetical protein
MLIGILGTHWIPVLILSDIRPAGYQANLKAGYRITGACQISDTRPDFQLNIQIIPVYEIDKDINCMEGFFSRI